jgi:thymidylate kinase
VNALGAERGLRRPIVVEIVGPAGAGKSTVFEGLLRRHKSVEPKPILARPPYRPLLARHLASALATLVRLRLLGRRTTLAQVVMMAYLRALPRAIDSRETGRDRVVVFDQGPVYFLTRPSIRDGRLTAWWDRSAETWSSRLDAVVWLDAPDTVLLERINSRRKWHALKGQPEQQARDVLMRSRAVYEEVLERLGANGNGPLILRFDTSRQSADKIVADVLAAVDGAGSVRARL